MKAVEDCTKSRKIASSPDHSVPHYRRVSLQASRETPASCGEPVQGTPCQNHALKQDRSESTTQLPA